MADAWVFGRVLNWALAFEIGATTRRGLESSVYAYDAIMLLTGSSTVIRRGPLSASAITRDPALKRVKDNLRCRILATPITCFCATASSFASEPPQRGTGGA